MSSVSILKDTKYEWIGSIPSHWELIKIKYVFWDRKENNNPIKSDNLISLTIDKGVIPHSEKTGAGNKPKEDLSKYKLVYPGDIVLNSMNVIAGAVGISEYFGVVSPVYYMLIPRNVDHSNKYFHHLFRTESFQKSLYGLGNGILIKESEKTGKLNTIRMRIPMDKLVSQFIPIPPPEEQKLISRYLDHKTKQIDLLIEKIQKKIELLKEQRTSLINELVTKGLNPNIEMKVSGADWIDKIPKHWRIIKPKYLLNRVTRPVEGDDEVVTCFRDGIVTLRKNRRVDGFTISIKEHGYQQVRPGDLVVHEMDGFAGAIGISDAKGKCTPVYTVIEPDRNNNLKYMALLLKVMATTGKIESLARSIRERTTDFRWKTWSNIKLPNPTLKEQDLIVNFLEKKNKGYDELIELYKQKKQNLIEYRQSLISTVVTGKFRITEDML